MLAQYKSQTNIGVGVGTIAQLAGLSMIGSPQMVAIGILIFIIGFVLFIWGCASYAKGKGHSGFLGILGFLSLPGLIILALLPDRYKDGVSPKARESVDATAEAMERLSALRDKGLITDEEFRNKREALLS